MIRPRPQSPLRTVSLAASVAAIAIAIASGSLIAWRSFMTTDHPATRVTGEALITSRFSLVDHTGRPVTERDYLGRWQLVFFGYTSCPDVCPTTLAYMASVLDILGGKADRVAPLFISVDPARDTPEVLAEYVAAFHPRLIGLTGTVEQVAAAAQAFRVYYERMDETAAPEGYQMAHSGYIYLMTPKGRFEAAFREGRETPEQLADEILMRIRKDEGS
jgi:cytochrome oxidase Cu insertion factor (SCO1/SenC/PrrC family)